MRILGGIIRESIPFFFGLSVLLHQNHLLLPWTSTVCTYTSIEQTGCINLIVLWLLQVDTLFNTSSLIWPDHFTAWVFLYCWHMEVFSFKELMCINSLLLLWTNMVSRNSLRYLRWLALVTLNCKRVLTLLLYDWQ